MVDLLCKNFKKNSGEIIYLISQYSSPIIGLFVNIIVMKYLEPEVLGKYQSIIIWSTYFSFLQLGVFNGLNRNLSYYKGANRLNDLKIATNTGFSFSLIVSFFSLFMVFALYNSKFNDESNLIKFAFLSLAIYVFFQPLTIFLDTIYRTGQDFKKLGKYNFIDNIIYLFNTLLIILFGFIGYVFQAIFKSFISFFLRIYGKRKNLKFNFSIHSFKDQLHTGFPLMINGYLYTTFFIFDQFYIVNKFDAVELGNYNLARLLLIVIPIIPTSLGTILYPKASNAYGKSGNNNCILKNYFIKALLINFLIIVSLVVFLYFTIESIVVNFLPKYENGIEYAKISIIGGLGYIFVGPSIILGVLKKNLVNFLGLLILSLSTYGLYFIGFFKFNEIIPLIWFKNILFILYSLIMLIYTYNLVNTK